MWIDNKYKNDGFNPAIGEIITIGKAKFEVLMWGKKSDCYTWTIVNWDTRREYELTEEQLYNRLKANNIC